MAISPRPRADASIRAADAPTGGGTRGRAAGAGKTDEVLKRDNGEPFRESHVADLLAKVAREAGMPPHGPHTLRHTFCSHLAMRGAAVGAIQVLAGHQDLMTTQRYMHLSPNMLDAAIALLDVPRSCEAHRGDVVETLAGVSTSD